MSGTANWYSANIVDFSDYTVTLSWKQCAGSFLMGVRYAWRETPCYYLSCPIYGLTTKLPATPFIYQGLITEQRTLL
jgi:sialate O-acetylesterase